MIHIIKKDLFLDVPLDGTVPIIIAHGCNAQGKMRSGFAKVVRDLNEGVFNEYIQSGHQLGTVSYFELYPNVMVANCVTQENFGYDGKRYTSYDAVEKCCVSIHLFTKLWHESHSTKMKVLFPLIGAGLGGGNKNIINTIIDETITDSFADKFQYIKD